MSASLLLSFILAGLIVVATIAAVRAANEKSAFASFFYGLQAIVFAWIAIMYATALGHTK